MVTKLQKSGESIYLKSDILGVLEIDVTAKYGLSKEDYQILKKPDKVHFDVFSCFLSVFIGLFIDTIIRIGERYCKNESLLDTVLYIELFFIFVLFNCLWHTYHHNWRNFTVDSDKKDLLMSIETFYKEKRELIRSALLNNIKSM